MTDTLLATAVTAAGGIIVATITGVVSYRSARWNLRRELEVDLRRQRLEAFKARWALSEPLPSTAGPAPLQQQRLPPWRSSQRIYGTGTSPKAGCSLPTSRKLGVQSPIVVRQRRRHVVCAGCGSGR